MRSTLEIPPRLGLLDTYHATDSRHLHPREPCEMSLIRHRSPFLRQPPRQGLLQSSSRFRHGSILHQPDETPPSEVQFSCMMRLVITSPGISFARTPRNRP